MSKKAKGIEELLTDLQNSLNAMSSGSMNLEESIREYAKAAELITQCHAQLKDARIRVQEIDEHLASLEAAHGI